MDDTFTDKVFSLKNNEFYTFIQELVGQQIVDILKFQSITSTQSLIRNPNIFGIFNMKCTEPTFLSIRERSCFHLDDGQFIVKIGLMNSLNYLLDFLKQQQQKKIIESGDIDSNVSLSFDFINKHPLLKTLVLWYQQIDNDDINNKDKNGFLKDFIDTITNNLTKSSSLTKWRSRLLSSTAELRLDDQPISINHLYDIINNENYTKLDHGLTKSDINPKDRQNFSSRLKLVSADVFEI
ncbi:unnamed protein product [Rotaria sp. Silwood2]|nr:unnamed protein product [Rotaria sp. Silwood2]